MINFSKTLAESGAFNTHMRSMQLHLHSNCNPPPATHAMMATGAGETVDLNTISTVVAGVLTSLQSTPSLGPLHQLV